MLNDLKKIVHLYISSVRFMIYEIELLNWLSDNKINWKLWDKRIYL